MATIHVWMILFMFFFFIEIMTVSLVSIWFCVGTGAAIAACHYGAPLWLQIMVFCLASGFSLALIFPFRKKLFKLKKTNIDSLIGEKCIVTKDINGKEYFGEILVRGQYWSATSEKGIIRAGEKATITKISGAHVVIRKEGA